MSITSGAIAWEALEEIRRDIDVFLKESATAASTDSKRKGTARAASEDNEVTRLKEEMEQLKIQLREARGAGGEESAIVLRKRQRGASDGFEDERDAMIRQLTLVMEQERVERSLEAEKHKAMMDELHRNNDKLLRQVKFLTAEEEAAQRELKEKTEQLIQDKLQVETELRQARRERDELQAQHVQTLNERDTLKRSAAELRQKQSEVERSKELVRKLENELGKSEGLQKARTALELEVESLKFRLNAETQRRQQLEDAEAKRPDSADLMKALQAKVQEQERVVKRQTNEMESLRNDRQNAKLLEEKIHELESTCERLEQKLMGMAGVEAKYEGMVAEKRHMDKQFEAVLKDRTEGEGEVTANRVLRYVRTLQNEQAQVWARLGDSEARCATLTKELAEAKQRVQKEAEAGTSLEDRQFMLSEQLRVAETRIKVLERENASLKRLLDMFGTSGSMLAAGTAQGLALGTGVRGEGGEEASVSETRVAELEEQLREARRELAETQTRMGGLASPHALAKTKGRVSELERQLESLEDEASHLRVSVKTLEQQLAQQKAAGTSAGAGEGEGEEVVDPTKTRVLHMTNNPSTLALREEVARLRTENETLKSQVGNQSMASESVSGTGDGSGGTSVLVDRNVYGQRLREMFQQRVNLFRDAVYQLTGYMATLKTEREFPQVQLRSMYAEEEDDFLLFQWTDGELQLVETKFTSRKMNKSLFTYLERCHSYPAFLSSLTLDLFSKQTMC